jgi:hypothetical protein
MPTSELPLAERIARVLAGEELSANAGGDDPSAGASVDAAWRDHRAQALAILHTMREPDEAMASIGDSETWSRMVAAAIDQAETPAG